MSGGLSHKMRWELEKIVDAGGVGVAISNTNRTAQSLAARGMIEQMERSRSDQVTFRWRWRATDAGREALK